MAGAETPKVEVVEHEFTNRVPQPATPRITAPVMTRPQFIANDVLHVALLGSSHNCCCLRLGFAVTWFERAAGNRGRLDDFSDNVVR